MAERRQGAQDPTLLEVKPTEGAEELKASAPEPSDKANKVVGVKYPISEFVVEGVPVITAAGTPLTAKQLDEVAPVAKASGVVLVVDGEVQS